MADGALAIAVMVALLLMAGEAQGPGRHQLGYRLSLMAPVAAGMGCGTWPMRCRQILVAMTTGTGTALRMVAGMARRAPLYHRIRSEGHRCLVALGAFQ